MSLSVDIQSIAHSRVLVFGDVMLDSYWAGNTQRISPEAPVPVVHVQDHYRRPGGAANVALNIAALGSQAILVGLVGDDDNATALENALTEQNVIPKLVRIPKGQTITKLRIMSRNQQLIRLDTEDGFADYDREVLLATAISAADQADIVVLSDYNKGTLRPVLKDFISHCRQAGKPVLVDPKGNDFSIYSGATLLTPNMSEFEAVAGKSLSEDEFFTRAQALMSNHQLDNLLVTRSEKGMALFQPNADAFTLPAQVREVFDVTGAGDTVIAVLSAALGAQFSFHDSVTLANLAAGIVVGKMGTATVSLKELQVAIASTLHSQVLTQRGIVDAQALTQQASLARAKGETIVMTNGCFDILHAGHVHYLNEARKLGDRLIVAVNSDDSIKRLKGESRPINSLEHRMQVLAALECVDWVVPFSDDTPAALIDAVVPDKLVKGGDYRPEDIVGFDTVTAAGGEVLVIDLVAGCSTTNIIQKILDDK